MFLIAKIVRGRRLLHELEKQEKDEHLAADASVTDKNRAKESSPTEAEQPAGEPSQFRPRRSRTVRKKAGGTGSVDSSAVMEDGKTARKSSSMPSIYDLQQASSSVVPLRHYNYDGKLNKLQKRAIRFTWHRLQTRNGGKRVENVFEEVFEKLIKILPNIRDMFSTRMFLCAMSRGSTSSLRDHSRGTVKMIDVVVKNLDVEKSKRSDTGTENDPRHIGRAHSSLKPYGLTGNYWEKFGEVMIDVVLAQEAVRDLPGAGQAWVIFTACLVDQLRAGFDESRRNDHDAVMKKNTVLHHATQQLLEDVSVAQPQPQMQQTPIVNVQLQTLNDRRASVVECPFAKMSIAPKSIDSSTTISPTSTQTITELADGSDMSETVYL
ncbi:unnamed protein product [Caenorhabditis angaria]|uniref:Globin family profile domain-containing protein n=1 Tax=Caenorhabditis angaria TaxID=860376 RepID=A0A9P1J3D8_9PELO|nr:unnamed protein product [Caenorhabditis angaria]